GIDGRLRNERFKFCPPLLWRVAAFKAGSTFDLADEREQRTVGMMRRAEIAQRGVRLALQALSERQRNVRLADPWLAGQHDHSTFALRGISPPPQQQLALLVTPEQLRQLGLV